jgi:hypothetical protein
MPKIVTDRRTGRRSFDGPIEKNPTAYVRLERGLKTQDWIVISCPHCGQEHIHGGIPLDQDPRTLLGHRSAHCVVGDVWPDYTLVEADERAAEASTRHA